MVDLYPNREFWENSLEMPVDHWLSRFQNIEISKNWLDSLSGKQLSIIFQHCFKHKQNVQLFQFQKHDDISAQEQRRILKNYSDSLFNYYLLCHFNHSKLEFAVTEIAKSVLTGELIEQCLCKNNKYDKKSLLFTLLHINPESLKHIYHFDKMQKRSFSYYTLQNSLRQMSISFKNFLSEETIQELLRKYDDEQNDSFESQLQSLLLFHDRLYLLIRRANDTDLLMSANRVIHGYKPDQIMLDFSLSGNQVNLCAKNFNQSLKIANSIVSHYFERECLFINMQDQNLISLVKTFFKACINEDDVNIYLFELKFWLAESEIYLTLGVNDKCSIIEGLQVLKLPIDNILCNVLLIKIKFQDKKVTLSFKINPQNPEYTTIYYSEHVLNKKEREDFKSLMKERYGLTILSRPKISE